MRKSAKSKIADTLPALPPLPTKAKKRNRAGPGLVAAKIGPSPKGQRKRRGNG